MKSWIVILAVCFVLGMSGCAPSEGAQNPEYAFSYQNIQIQIHQEAASVIAALGEPEAYTEEPSCAFEGLDKNYDYGSFCLSTYPDGETDYVYRVWLVGEDVSTEEGIHIGSSRSQVEAAYGAEGRTDSGDYRLTGETMELLILLEEDVVTSIQYVAILL